MNCLQKARTQLVLDYPFFAALALTLIPEETNRITTLATDGSRLLYNPEYVEQIGVDKLKGCVAHLVLHCALGHTWRGEGKEQNRWQRAADLAINSELLAAQFDLPEGYLNDPAYQGMNAEEIYEALRTENSQEHSQQKKKDQDQQENQQQGKKKRKRVEDPGKCGAAIPPKEHSVQEEKAKWDTQTAKALLFATDQGELPSELERMLRQEINPKIPWTTLLRDFVEHTARNDYNWNRINARHLQRGFVLPTLISEDLPRVLVAVDTSMSISDADLNMFASEISGILGAYRTITDVVYCDAKLHGLETFASEDLPIQLHPKGGGGTNFCPVFEYSKTADIEYACIIFFTDLRGVFPKEEPDCPLLWISTSGDRKAPIGETISF